MGRAMSTAVCSAAEVAVCRYRGEHSTEWRWFGVAARGRPVGGRFASRELGVRGQTPVPLIAFGTRFLRCFMNEKKS
jgi:hypothetical protein